MSKTRFSYSEPFSQENVEKIRFRRQWIVGPPNSAIHPLENSIPLNSKFQLSHHPELRLSHLKLGTSGILILGLAIDCCEPEKDVLSHFEAAKIDLDMIAEKLDGIAGTYVLIFYSQSEVYFFTDPMGMMGVYYGKGFAASTPALIPGIQRDESLDATFPLGKSNEWYPGSLLPFHDMKYLLANHYLRLVDGSRKRFWPRTEFGSIDQETGTQIICDQLQAMVRGAVSRGNVLASLSGGKDSRSVLAASRELHESIEYFTLYSDSFDALDYKFAKQLVDENGLNHKFLEITPPEPWLVDLYDEMTAGMVYGAARMMIEPLRRDLASSRYIHMNGAAGEICSPFYWHSANPTKVKMNILMRKHGSKPPQIIKAFEEWYATVEHFSPITIYNLMFVEQIEGRWQGSGETASNIFYESFTPYCNREIVKAVCSLPNQVVHENKLRFEFVRRMWPELLNVPYSKPGFFLSKFIPRTIKDNIKYLISPTFRSYVKENSKIDRD